MRHMSPHLLKRTSFHLCAESMGMVVDVLSRVESDGEAGANLTAAPNSAVSKSRIDPVSRDSSATFFLTAIDRMFVLYSFGL